MARDVEGQRHGFDQALGQHDDALGLRVRGELDDRELVSAQSRDDIRLANAASDALRDGLQESVSDRVSQRVVHAFELIEVEAQDRQALAPTGPREFVIEAFAEEVSVRQSGEAVMVRHVHQLRLELLLRRDRAEEFVEGPSEGREFVGAVDREPPIH